MRNDNTVSFRLKKARKEAGYKSSLEFANKNELSASTYRHHENGIRNISIDQALHYSKLLCISPGWLMTGATDSIQREALSTQFIFDENLLAYLFKAIFNLAPSVITKLDKDYMAGTLVETYKTCLNIEKDEKRRLEIANKTVSSLENFFKEKNKFIK